MVNVDQSGLHRFWSIYEDSSCSGAPTGVFMQRLNDCVNQVAASGDNCAAKYDDNNNLVGFVNQSCYDGRLVGLETLYGGVSFMAYDYYNNNDCTDFGNSASYQASGDCMSLYDGYSKFRSATVKLTNEGLVWKRNMGDKGASAGALNCPGSSGSGYFEFDVPAAGINTNFCMNKYTDIPGGFIFYNMTATVSESGSGSSIEDVKAPGSGSSSSLGTPSTPASSSLGVGAIAGIAVGATVLMALVVVAFAMRNRSTNTDLSSLRNPLVARGSAFTGGTTGDSEQSSMGPGLWNDDAIVATRIPRDQVKVGTVLSRGGFGEVYRGSYIDEDVAIKMLFPEMRRDLKKVNAFLAEAKLMAWLVHPHVVRYVGVSWRSLADLCMLTELMKGGDLRTLLKEYEAQKYPQGFDHDKTRIAYHIAQALTYMHSLSPIVIHRDLKSKNVLLTEDLQAKLTDFGASRECQEHTMTAGVGTMLWMAPEIMMAERYTEKADVFSFGVLLSELDLQALPYSHARVDSTGKKVPDAVIIQKVSSGSLKVQFSPGCLADMVELGKECVALDPSARPSAPMVVFRLQTIMKKGSAFTRSDTADDTADDYERYVI
ncbi:unnamed protein product [Phytophthora fragariaefolia]|uniref:Unnamed protein product n=1 Tax=Phytophthora fragariaefolia TaxID=1490495 RepID=A0A9W6U2J2_9STRA|nr:unnamed protein product [Phytophthora fragariaefolia]